MVLLLLSNDEEEVYASKFLGRSYTDVRSITMVLVGWLVVGDGESEKR